MRLRTLFPIATLVCALALALAAPAGAIIGGQPDGTAHPWVGAVAQGHEFCSGTLLAPTIMLTAAHCFQALALIGGQPAGPVIASFDPGRISRGTSTFVTGTWFPDPQFCFGCGNGLPGVDTHDVAVVVLNTPVAAPAYGQLPALGLADTLPNKTTDTIVGYGVRDFIVGGGPKQPNPLDALTRYQGTAQFVLSNDRSSAEFLKVSANNAQGKAGVCFGDSGGPNFVGSSTTILGINSFVDRGCTGVTYAFRVDTAQVQSFIRGTALRFGGVTLS